MKKLLPVSLVLFTVILFSYNKAFSQITITQADFSVIGDSIIEVNDTMPSAAILVGGAGSQTWDFSSLQAHSIDTAILIDPATTPFASDFPSATLATETNGFFGFLNVGATDVFIEGFAGLLPPPLGIAVVVPFMPTQQIMVFPDTVGSSFQDTSGFKLYFSGADVGFPFVDSAGNLHTSYLTYSVDGYGMITTPAGTYNTIRGLTVEITIDSIVVKDPILTGGVWILADPGLLGFPNPTLDTTYTYSWLANGMGSPIVEVETDTLGGTAVSASYRLGNAFVALFDGDFSTKCKGDCDGEAMPTIINGVTPLTYSWNTTPVQTNAMATGLCLGTHTVTITDVNSAMTSATVNLVEPLNILSLVASSVTPTCDTCMDGTATVSAFGGDTPYAYLWDDPGTQTTATATGLSPGNYVATVTDANGCVKTIADTVNVGIQEALAKPVNFKVYPNPTSGTLTISVDDNIDFMYLYGAKGELLMVEDVSGSEHVIDISAYQDGLYLLKLVNKDIVLTRKVFLIR